MKKFDVCDIPGSLYGNSPGVFASDPTYGNVVIADDSIQPAFEYLKKHRFRIDRTKVHTTDSIAIHFVKKN